MKVTRMKYNSMEDIEYILNKSGRWEKDDSYWGVLEESDVGQSVSDFDPNVSVRWNTKPKNGKYHYNNMDIALFIHPNLTFDLLICNCDVGCCGSRRTNFDKFSMRNVYKVIKKFISLYDGRTKNKK